jgi:hypothetical protein
MHLDFQRRGIPIAIAVFECVATTLCIQPSAVAQTNTSVQDRQAIDRAEGEGDKVFKWILIHSDKPRKSAASKDEKPALNLAKTGASRASVARSAGAGPAAVAAPAPSAAPAGTATVESQAVATVETKSEEPSESTPSSDAPTKTDEVMAVASPASTANQVNATPEPERESAEPLVETLMPLKRVDPKIPPRVGGATRGGHVEVHFTVLTDGSVSNPAVSATDNRRLIPYALDAVAQWKFAPLKRPQTGGVDLVFDLE